MPLEPIDLMSPTFASAVHAICLFIQISTPNWANGEKCEIESEKNRCETEIPPKTDLQSWWSLSICMQKNRLKYAFQATYSNKMFNRDWKSYLEYFVRRSIFNLLFYKSFEYYFKVLTCAAGDSITKICAEIYEQIGAGHNE